MRNYKLFGKIPIFDLIVVLVLAVIAVLGYNILNTSKSGESITSTEIKKIRYVIEFSNLSELIDGLPKEGEKIYNNNNNYEMGTVVSSESEPYVFYDFNRMTGETVSTVCNDSKLKNNRVTVRVTVETNATVSDRGIDIDGTKIGIGKNMTYSMPSLCATGVIYDIVEVEG